MGLVFYNRTKPWKRDAANIALKYKISFIGYWLLTGKYDGTALRSCIADFSSSKAEWSLAISGACQQHSNNGAYTPDFRQSEKNRNLVKDVKPGDIVLMPRPTQGKVYAARISQRGFELANNPPWAADFKALLGSENAGKFHEVEVAQCWHVDEWKEIPFLSIPGWIRRSLFGQATCNRVPTIDGLSPHATISALMENPLRSRPSWTTDRGVVAERLREALGPATFEHLVVALLQLEEPGRTWLHVGGSGDGGADGLASDAHGNIEAVLQCKWSYAAPPIELSDRRLADSKIERVFACLIYGGRPALQQGIRFLGVDEIVGLVLKHRARLPMALTLRIGDG